MHSRRIHEKVKNDYDLIAKSFSATRQTEWKDFDLFVPFFNPKMSVLDLGCGNGRLLSFLKKNELGDYLGIDQSEGLLNLAKSAHPDYEFALADMSELKDINGTFDHIMAIASFHHIDPKYQLETLKLWKSYLKSDGTLMMINWNLFQSKFFPLWLKKVFWPFSGLHLLIPWKSHGVKRYYYAFTKRRLKRLLEKAGYTIVEQKWVKHGHEASFLKAHNLITIAKHAHLER